MDQRLQHTQKLSQEQIIAPQQIQSLNILAAPMLELQKKIIQEAEVNPTLEIISANEEAYGDFLSENLPSENNNDLAADVISRDEALIDLVSNNDNWREYIPNAAASNSESESKRQHFFDSLHNDITLSEKLLEQLRLTECSEEISEIATYIIGSLDDHGFLPTSIAELAKLNDCTQKKIKEALDIVQQFEPFGIASPGFRECLLKQLEKKGRQRSTAYKIIDKHLDLIENNHIPQLAKKIKETPEVIYKALEEIKSLKPFPVEISSRAESYVQPDVTIERDANGELDFKSNRNSMPKIRISESYEKALQDPKTSSEVKNYLREKIASSRGLIHSIDERLSTISRITEILLQLQKDFFTEGIEALRPLTMGQVAERIGLHETTISRAVANKYMQTDNGLIPYRFFFNSGYVADNGKTYTSLYIKQEIADMIQLEDSKKPLSDQQIVEEFALNGLQISARTIAKYREDQSIPPAKLRRTF